MVSWFSKNIKCSSISRRNPKLFKEVHLLSPSLISGLIAATWFSALFVKFNFLNHKREDLFLLFLRICNEIPYEDQKKNHLVGLTKEENDDYWRKNNKFCIIYNRVFNVLVLVIASIFNISTFYISFQLNPFIYAATMTINVIHNTYFLFSFFQAIFTLNVFFISIVNFFSRKYGHIAGQVRLLKEKGKFSNRKLEKLIDDFNRVCLEMQLINKYWKHFLGINFVLFFFIGQLPSNQIELQSLKGLIQN